MGMRLTGNRSIAVVQVNDKAASIRLRMLILKSVVRNSCGRIRSEAVCVVCSAPSGSRALRWSVGVKKRLNLPPLSETLVSAEFRELLELDERWSFVAHKSQARWSWSAWCRRTRQVVASAIGDRSKRTCQQQCKPFLRRIARGSVSPIAGRRIRQSFPTNSIMRWAKRRGRPPRWNDGTTPCASVWLVLYA